MTKPECFVCGRRVAVRWRWFSLCGYWFREAICADCFALDEPKRGDW